MTIDPKSLTRNWNYPTSVRFRTGPHRRTARRVQGPRHEAAAAGH